MFLLNNNNVVCLKTIALFGKVTENFLVGGNETNLIVDTGVELKIVGADQNKNSKKSFLTSAYQSLCIRLGQKMVAISHDLFWREYTNSFFVQKVCE